MMKTMTDGGDPLAHASAKPDVSALITEFTRAMQEGPTQPTDIAWAEDTRLNRWQGKSSERDGCMWQKNQPQGKIVRPYDGRPDTDVNLCDELIATETDMDMMSLGMAQVGADTTHTTPLTAAQCAELTAVGRWIRKAIRKDARDGAELLSQMKGELGWAVLNPGWMERYSVGMTRLTMDELIELCAQQPDGSNLRNLPVLVLDPELEADAIEVAQEVYPDMPRKVAARIVRELRNTGETQIPERRLEEKRPTVRVLIPGYNFFVSGGTGDLQRMRGALRIEFFYQAELEGMAADKGWNEEFIERAVKTAGMVSSFGEELRRDLAFEDGYDKRIEVWTTEVRQVDEETGVTGIYCTTFSPHVNPGAAEETGPEHYATHYLLDYAHGQYPYVAFRREVIGPAIDDSRGVPEMVRSDQKVIKTHQDALAIRAQLETNPPRVKIGPGWSKVKDEYGPGAEMTVQMGADFKHVDPPRGNPQVSEAVIERVENGSRRRFALPTSERDGTHPSLWQMRQLRNAGRWLGGWEEAYWQMAVMCYAEFTADELAGIIGRWPQLTVRDLLKHAITLTFDARSLDKDWVKTTLEFVGQLLMWDNGGLMDRAPLLKVGLSYIDPTLAQGVLREPAGAQAALYEQVQKDVASIMDFNPPPLREMDPSAGMQVQMAFSVVGKNPMYQKLLERVPLVRDNFETYLKNLQHSEQQTQISPVQGRLGVGDMPQRPVQKGAPVEA